jgi:putative hydrolase of the HAD superfamily
MKADLILFDLDDTLMAFDIVSDKAWDKAVDEFIQCNNINIEKNILLEKINTTRKWYWADSERHKIGRENINNARKEIVKLALENYLNVEIRVLEDLADNYSNVQESYWYLFDGVVETLQKIKKMGIKIGIITNGTSESQRKKIKRFYIEKYFNYIFIEGEIGYGKPDIRMYEQMLQMTKIENNKIIMVGDNLIWDIEPPNKLGIYTIWINTKGIKLEDYNIRPNKIINKISEIIEIIK